MSSLVLGTVQFGMPYGIANRVGQPDQPTVNEIVSTAWEYGIREFDTAQGYGVSEEVVGRTLRVLGLTQKARVLTKFDPMLDHLNRGVLFKALEASRARLGVERIHGVFLHREESLALWEKGMGDIFKELVESGTVVHVGVSVYIASAALRMLDTEGLTIIQLPTNILDRRFEQARIFDLAKKKGVMIYIRSAFIQGLLLMDPRELPEVMAFARPVLERVGEAADEFGLTRKELALGYLKMAFPDAKILFGAETAEQVEENCRTWDREYPPSLVAYVRDYFPDVDERILNPSLWQR